MENKLIKSFFDKSFEVKYNQALMERSYVLPTREIEEYISELCSIDYQQFVEYIYKSFDFEPITSKNIFQFSSFDDCTENLCRKIEFDGDNGLRFEEIGKLLEDDGKPRTSMAYKKYGENATKTANELGLTQIIDYYSFLSCFGKVYPSLPAYLKKKFTNLLIIRTNFFKNLIYLSRENEVNPDQLISFLEESTRGRRLSNLRKLCDILNEEDSDYLKLIVSRIVFKKRK